MKKLLTLTLFATVATASAAENCRVINMGFNPAQDSSAVLTSGKAIATYLESKIRGVEVRTTVAQDYQALVEATRSGKLDFAWLSPVSYVQAHDQAGAQVLLKSVRNGGPYYWSAFVVRKDSGIKTLNDLRGKTVAWIDPTSAAGYTFPRALLVSKGINPDTFFSKQTFAGKHDAAVLSLANGTVDAIATFSNNTQGTSGSWTQYLPADKASQLAVVAYTKPIPGDTLSVRSDYQTGCADVVTRVRAAIIGMKSDPAGQGLLKKLYTIDSMIPAKDADYNVVRDAVKASQKK
ncbi:phosphate/phosphite/phosphonate ABC transporter substrate-binding protein [Deinococcus sonorensis]|uniref:Phosphate/phosphite/phosphonate ABC transporter substrate-binding protein n=2 Tax=Deinococcus sonorensis TaxID=309891 RepID=A0AAU7UCX7_9DEIO